MLYARIDLSKTNYTTIDNWDYLKNPNVVQLNDIYTKYCRYKKFKSVMPIFDSQFTAGDIDVLGYYDKKINLVAFSMIRRFDQHNAECMQFAWDYVEPGLRLGIETMKHECALYKHRGFKYLYLGGADEYKQQIDGFEILGPL